MMFTAITRRDFLTTSVGTMATLAVATRAETGEPTPAPRPPAPSTDEPAEEASHRGHLPSRREER